MDFKKFKELFFPKKEKVIEEPGVIGHYDSKPFDNFKYALIYANEIEVFNDGNVLIYTREYKKTTFINVLVYEEVGFDYTKYNYESLKPLLVAKQITPTDKSIVVIAFQHKNDNTISYCKKLCVSDKNNFQQGMIYNPRSVQMDYYKPVPDFYKLYDHFCEDLYFDLAFIDSDRS